MELWPGSPFPLGVHFDGSGVNVAVYSEVAEAVDVCLFTASGEERVRLSECTAYVHHGYLPGIRPGQRYGFRVHGPWDPDNGDWCNQHKLLIDPYARAIEGDVRWDDAVFGYTLGADGQPRDDRDSARFVPKSVVTNPWFEWGNEPRPRRPLHETVIYEAHVKGTTIRHPEVEPSRRGTYEGLADPVMLDHYRRLGVTAIELMPVHHFIHDHHLVERRLRNYWGYNSIGFFAPYSGYARESNAGAQVEEFKRMVKTLHEAGLEVILDVVYNHTAEGNHLGPTLAFRGLDNRSYYRTVFESPRYYMDYTGTGNTLNMRHPHVLQLLMDSLRYWVTEMHVDGFRFDLAAALARELHDVDRLSAFFDLIQQDPVIQRVKLIAEPWDVGEGGYQVGNFPPLWSEWNGKYRDCVRDYWRGSEAGLAEFASRITGSSDLYEANGRTPSASVNFVTAHDGFTLRDLVSYNHKHNEANLEDNRDGTDDNRSWNHGAEGRTRSTRIQVLRARQQRNFIATMMVSQGVPMLLHGDELSRTQRGNNNVYCQDNPIAWIDWRNIDRPLLSFVGGMIAFRHAHRVFRRRRWFIGTSERGHNKSDIGWYTPHGAPMSEQDWSLGFARSLAVVLDGREIPSPDPRGRNIVDSSFTILFNAHHETVEFTLPVPARAGSWVKILDTADGRPPLLNPIVEEGGPTKGDLVKVKSRAMVILEDPLPVKPRGRDRRLGGRR